MKRQEWKSNGRTVVMDDSGITITPSRLDVLGIASSVYDEWVQNREIDHEEIPFGKWLKTQIDKENENEES